MVRGTETWPHAEPWKMGKPQRLHSNPCQHKRRTYTAFKHHACARARVPPVAVPTFVLVDTRVFPVVDADASNASPTRVTDATSIWMSKTNVASVPLCGASTALLPPLAPITDNKAGRSKRRKHSYRAYHEVQRIGMDPCSVPRSDFGWRPFVLCTAVHCRVWKPL